MLITTSVYMGSSIVSPSIMEFSTVFGVGSVTATLTLSVRVTLAMGYFCMLTQSAALRCRLRCRTIIPLAHQ